MRTVEDLKGDLVESMLVSLSANIGQDEDSCNIAIQNMKETNLFVSNVIFERLSKVIEHARILSGQGHPEKEEIEDAVCTLKLAFDEVYVCVYICVGGWVVGGWGMGGQVGGEWEYLSSPPYLFFSLLFFIWMSL